MALVAEPRAVRFGLMPSCLCGENQTLRQSPWSSLPSRERSVLARRLHAWVVRTKPLGNNRGARCRAGSGLFSPERFWPLGLELNPQAITVELVPEPREVRFGPKNSCLGGENQTLRQSPWRSLPSRERSVLARRLQTFAVRT